MVISFSTERWVDSAELKLMENIFDMQELTEQKPQPGMGMG